MQIDFVLKFAHDVHLYKVLCPGLLTQHQAAMQNQKSCKQKKVSQKKNKKCINSKKSKSLSVCGLSLWFNIILEHIRGPAEMCN